jgi:hypothetical protein
MSSHRTRIAVAIPNVYVKERPKPPAPPPFPGTVTFEDIRPPVDPPLPFLVPWVSHTHAERSAVEGKEPIPVDVNPEMLAKFTDRHDLQSTLQAVFKGSPNVEELVEDVINSMASPFKSNASPIVWSLTPAVQPNPAADDKLGGKKLKNRHKILTGQPWSITSFADVETGVIRRNMVYDGEGNAMVQVDFGHGKTVGIHCHALVTGNLEHTAVSQEDHLFHMLDVPWMWLCVPWGGRGVASAAALPPTADEITYCAVTVPFEDFSCMGDAERTDSSS